VKINGAKRNIIFLTPVKSFGYKRTFAKRLYRDRENCEDKGII
jgi:hypothetical protein